jgi:Fe-Mn family superoxide dismutase
MPFTLMPLPFAKDSLGPTLSAATLEEHHGKHHAAYVKKLNDLIAGTKFVNADLETIVRTTMRGAGKQRHIFNNAAQVWNHDFLWESLAPNGGGTPPEPVLQRLQQAFGSFETFREKLIDAAVAEFGSGWIWLVSNQGKLEIRTTHDADNPLTSNMHALWTCDLWEHAYYLDYQHERAEYVAAVIDNVANWQWVSKRLTEETGQAPRFLATGGGLSRSSE